jgi:uncharacterized protein YqgC (DUF456 family)
MLASFLQVFGLILFGLVLVLGIAAIPLGFPGTFIIFGDALIYGLITRFRGAISWQILLILLALAAFSELVEFLLGTFTTLKFGASRWGVLGTLAGGILGAVWGSAVFPVVGTLLGALAGSFTGAFILELIHREDQARAAKAGFGAFVGRILGITLNLSCAIAMVAIIFIRLL